MHKAASNPIRRRRPAQCFTSRPGVANEPPLRGRGLNAVAKPHIKHPKQQPEPNLTTGANAHPRPGPPDSSPRVVTRKEVSRRVGEC